MFGRISRLLPVLIGLTCFSPALWAQPEVDEQETVAGEIRSLEHEVANYQDESVKRGKQNIADWVTEFRDWTEENLPPPLTLLALAVGIIGVLLTHNRNRYRIHWTLLYSLSWLALVWGVAKAVTWYLSGQ